MNAALDLAITFGSVCSGIEAASVAWHPLGWRACWLSEIEKFPCALLAHHYPEVPNLGDMRKIPAMLRNGDIFPPDVFTGGTPCQAFSLAGLRESLDDARGNLSLTFCEIANEIDIQRAANGLLPATVVWENVPGVLSTKDNAFGHFLAGLAGEDDPLVAPGKKWADAGCVYGPQRTVAWRILDAQFFALAQRRRRVFVVASARDGFDPARVLFEFEGVRRDSAPRREAGQDAAAGALRSTDGGCDVDHARAGHIQPVEVTGTLTACYGEQTGRDLAEMPGGLQVVQAFGGNNQAGPIDVATARHAFDARQSDVIQYGNLSGPLDTDGNSTGVMVPQPAIAFSCKDHGADASEELAPAMRAMGHSGSHANAGGQLAVTYPKVLAFKPGQSEAAGGIFITDDFAPTLQAQNNGSTAVPAVCITGDITHTLKAEGFDASEDGTGRGQPIVAAYSSATEFLPQSSWVYSDGEVAPTLQAAGTRMGNRAPQVQAGMAVRRLTPRECEKLQGFPPDYTLIPYGRAVPMHKLERDWVKYLLRGGVMTLDQVCRAAADGPRYKAIGNSWAVRVVGWIGSRIDAELKRLDAISAQPARARRATREKEMMA